MKKKGFISDILPDVVKGGKTPTRAVHRVWVLAKFDKKIEKIVESFTISKISSLHLYEKRKLQVKSGMRAACRIVSRKVPSPMSDRSISAVDVRIFEKLKYDIIHVKLRGVYVIVSCGF